MDAPKDRCAEAQRPALWTLGGGCLFAILVGVQCVQLWFNLHFPDDCRCEALVCFLKKNIHLFYFRLCWVFVAVCGRSLWLW